MVCVCLEVVWGEIMVGVLVLFLGVYILFRGLCIVRKYLGIVE